MKPTNGFTLRMKSIVLIFTVFLMLVKPIWPRFDYISNYDYIVSKLCENKDKPELQCNGKCYLSKMLAKSAQEEEEAPFTSKFGFEFLNVLFLEKHTAFTIGVRYETESSMASHKKPIYSNLYTDIQTPPPKDIA